MFLSPRRVFWFVVPALLLLTTTVFAEEKKNLSSSVTLELGRSSSDTDEAYLDLDLGLDKGMHLRAMLGRSQQTVGDQLQESNAWLLGVSSDYSARFVIAFDYEYWGDKSSLETWTRRIKLGTNTQNWFVQLRYEDRTSQYPSSTTTTGGFPGSRSVTVSRTAKVDSTGTGLSLSYYGLFPVALTVSYISYSYEQDPSVLKNEQGWLSRTSSSNTELPSSLESWRRSVDLSYQLNWGALGVSGSQGESVVDGSLASNVSAYLIWNLRDDWSLTLTGGQSYTDTSSDTVSYGRAALSHRW